MRARQGGVALVTAMLIVAIIAALATSLALGQQIWLRQTQNLADLAQAEKVRRGALEFAAAVLMRDARNARTSTSDDLTEDWAQPIPPLPVEGGIVVVTIEDAQARFNLNNLAQASVQTPGQNQGAQAAVATYRALLNAVGIDPAAADALTDALIDWIDADSTVRPQGAEDLDYLNYDPPYRTANQPLRSVDELRLIKGYDTDIIEKLRPHVVAICSGCRPGQVQTVAINVNTASPQVLAALTNRTPNEAEQLVQARERNPFKSTKDFNDRLGGQPPAAGSYAVQSGYFIVTVDTRIGRTQRRTEALIERSGNQGAGVLWYRQPSFQIVLDEDKSS